MKQSKQFSISKLLKKKSKAFRQNLFFHVFSKIFQWRGWLNLLHGSVRGRMLFMKLSVQEIKLPRTCQTSFDGQVNPAMRLLTKCQRSWDAICDKSSRGKVEADTVLSRRIAGFWSLYVRLSSTKLMIFAETCFSCSFKSSAKKLLFRSLSEQPAFLRLLAPQLLCWNQFI